MKRASKASLVFLLMFSLVCSPALAALNQNSSIHTINKSNGSMGIEANAASRVLIAQTGGKGFLQRFGFKQRNRKPKQRQQRQGFFSKFNLRRQTQQKPKVQQKQKRQGFWSRFGLKPNRKQKPNKQKRGFLQRFGFGRA